MGRSRGLMKYQIQEPPFSIEQILAGGMKEESGMARQFDEKYTTNELMMEFYERERPKMNLLSCPLDGMNAERQRLITGLREVLDIDKLKELLQRRQTLGIRGMGTETPAAPQGTASGPASEMAAEFYSQQQDALTPQVEGLMSAMGAQA